MMINLDAIKKNIILHNIEKSGNQNSGRHKGLDLNKTEILSKMLFSIDDMEKKIENLKHKNSYIKNHTMPMHNNRLTIGYQNLEKNIISNLKKIKQLEADLDNTRKDFNTKNSRWAKKY